MQGYACIVWEDYLDMRARKYIDKLKPQVSDTWRADEVWLKIKGDMKYLFALMDDETRYWIAQEVAESKYRHDARKLFQLAFSYPHLGAGWDMK